MNTTRPSRVALLLGKNEAHNSKLMAGIVGHMRHHTLHWNLLVPIVPGDADAPDSLVGHADAFIVNSDAYPAGTVEALQAHGAAVVCLSQARAAEAYRHLPTVSLDNRTLANKVHQHLTGGPACHFALFGARGDEDQPHLAEREREYTRLIERDGGQVSVFRCEQIGYPMFNGAVNSLTAWLEGLSKPVSIFAADEVRARMLSQACALAGFDVASGVVVAGVDCDPVAQELSPVPLAAAMFDRHEVGRCAALALQQVLERRLDKLEHLVGPMDIVEPPVKLGVAVHDPFVMRALHFIRTKAKTGIKAEQVAYFVGMSRSSLEQRFRRDMGRSVHDEILRFKLEESMQMLRRGTVGIPEIARLCGFTSVQYMYTVFGRELGCTPRAWRERFLKQATLAASLEDAPGVSAG